MASNTNSARPAEVIGWLFIAALFIGGSCLLLLY
jgi:hypothetical protein